MDNVADLILINGRFYTQNEDIPWAGGVAIKDDCFIYVGNDEVWKEHLGKETEVIDLDGKLVLPGLIDGHVHPETVAKSTWKVALPETEDITELLSFVKDFCETHSPEEVPYFFGESYPTTMFGEEGPHKKLLDKYVSDRPVRLQDFTDHSCWYNSKALELMEVKKGKPDPEGVAVFIRDGNGEPTGWVKEPGLTSDFEVPMFEKIGWRPPQEATKEMVEPFLSFLNSYGIIAILDGITEGESSMKLFYDLDRAGCLNMYYEGTCLLEDYEHLDECIATLREWQEKYISKHVGIHTIKFFLDGTNELGNCGVLEPFSNDKAGTDYGNMNMTEDELTKVLIRLNREGIDMHIHLVGDRSFRTACNAYERAKKECKEEWKIYLQLAHCELIDPSDMLRVAELGIIVNWSPHWGGGYFGEAAREWLGNERFNRMYDFTKIIDSGGTVTYSSDVIGQCEAHRANPYFGMECSHTRIDVEAPLKCGIRQPGSAKLPLEEMIRGYTIKGAVPFRFEDRMGSIEKGKLAHLVVLKQDLFEVPKNEIHKVEPQAVLFEGKLISGSLR
ncbi:MAG: amidohydrolase family protein [Eubacteriales bacterium]|nr:amidohydrolase family protein [Eubacteriales bacterium]MDD4583319.1 amidohydrolase family protein [Eubacteriales bacterium]